MAELAIKKPISKPDGGRAKSPSTQQTTTIVLPKNPFKFGRMDPSKKLELLETKQVSAAGGRGADEQLIGDPMEDPQVANSLPSARASAPLPSRQFASKAKVGVAGAGADSSKNYYKVIFDRMSELFPEHHLCKKVTAATAFNSDSADGELSCLLELAAILEKLDDGGANEEKDALECKCENNGKGDAACYPWFLKTLVYADIGVALLSSLRKPVRSATDAKVQSWALRVAARLYNLRNHKRQCKANPDYLENANPFFKEKSLFFSKKPANTYMEDCRNALQTQVAKISGDVMEALIEISIGKIRRRDDGDDKRVMVLDNPIVDIDTFKFIMQLLNNRVDDAMRAKCLEMMNALLLMEANLMKVLADKNWSEFMGLLMTKDSKRARMTISGPDEKVSADAEERMNVIRLEMNLLAMMICGAIYYEQDEKAFKSALENIQQKLTLESIGDFTCDMLRVALFSSLKKFQLGLKAALKNDAIDFKVMFRNVRILSDLVISFIFFQSNTVGRVELHVDDDYDLPDILVAKEVSAIVKSFNEMESIESPLAKKGANKFAKALGKFKTENQDLIGGVDPILEYLQMLRQGHTSEIQELQNHCEKLSKILVHWKQGSQKPSAGKKPAKLNDEDVHEIYGMLLRCADSLNSESPASAAGGRLDVPKLTKSTSKKRLFTRALFAKKLVKTNMQRMDETKDDAPPEVPKLRNIKSEEAPSKKPNLSKMKSTPQSARTGNKIVEEVPVQSPVGLENKEASPHPEEEHKPSSPETPGRARQKSVGTDENADKRKHSRSKSRGGGGGKSVHELPEMNELKPDADPETPVQRKKSGHSDEIVERKHARSKSRGGTGAAHDLPDLNISDVTAADPPRKKSPATKSEESTTPKKHQRSKSRSSGKSVHELPEVDQLQ
jgi:hypothetical protein